MKRVVAAVAVGLTLGAGGAGGAQAGTVRDAVRACLDHHKRSEAENAYCHALVRETEPGGEAEARALYLKAAEGGHAAAQFEVGLALRHGDGVARDMDAALAWYLKAAEQGLAEAQNNYAFVWFYGVDGMPKDRAKAIPWLRKAADQGFSSSQTLLAEAYYQGDGVEKDLDQAVRLYSAAMEQGHPHATLTVGVLYLRGEGVAKSPVIGAALVEKAARQNLAVAQTELAGLYLNGRGVEPDDLTALTWFEVAALNGEPDSRSAELKARLSPEQVAQAQQRARALADELKRKTR